MIQLLLQALPNLPSDPKVAIQSWTQLVFLVGTFFSLTIIVGVAFRARSTVRAMIMEANGEVVAKLGAVVVSVDKLTDTVQHLSRRDGVTEVAISTLQRLVTTLDNKVDVLSRDVSRLEGIMDGRRSDG